MVKDKTSLQSNPQEYRHALNACVESFDGNSYVIQNDASNLLAFDLNGQTVVGNVYIPSLEITLLFTKGVQDEIRIIPTLNTIDKQIPSKLEELIQVPLYNTYKLIAFGDFNFNEKISVKYKITDCTLNIYFVDGINPDRFLYFNLNDYSIVDDFLTNGVLDINKTNWNQAISNPDIELSSTLGGVLEEGKYQVFISYSTNKGIPLSSFYQSGMISIFSQVEKQIEGKEYGTTKAIKVNVNNLSSNSYYKYYTIVLASTINNTTTYTQVKTLPISSKSYLITKNEGITKSEQEVFFKYPYYKSSAILETSNNYLFKANVKEYEKINIQRIANYLSLQCLSVRVKEDAHKTSNNLSFMRDEVSAFGIELITKEGEITGVGHIAGRKARTTDLIPATNKTDVLTEDINWKVNNTASVTSSPHTDEVWETYDFAYWESSETYPNNYELFGDLSGLQIRHHKFPDVSISNIYSKGYIYPLAVKLNEDLNVVLNQAVTDNIITQEQKDRIVGYNLVVGNRAGEQSIIAKGLLYDVWSYEKPAVFDEKDTTCSNNIKYYYPSYPFNDLRDDELLAKDSSHYKYSNFEKGNQASVIKKQQFQPSGRYTFHSPDTSFAQPSLGSTLKIESEMYGEAKGFFSECDGQAKYKILTTKHYLVATFIAKFIVNNTDVNTGSSSNLAQGIGSVAGGAIGTALLPGIGTQIGSTVGGLVGSLMDSNKDVTEVLQKNALVLYQTEKFLQIFKNVADYKNHHYQYQAVGYYTNSKPPQFNNINRNIKKSSYLSPIKQSIDGDLFNNNFRESSVFLQVDNLISNPSVQDTSRIKISDTSTRTKLPCKKYSLVSNNQSVNANSMRYIDCNGVGQEVFFPAIPGFTYNYIYASSIDLGKDIEDYTDIDRIEVDCPECENMSNVYSEDCNCKSTEKTTIVSSYYGSIKNERSNQYGDVLGIDYINTEKQNNIYFGDTFITPFAFKRKHSFFNTSTFGLQNDTDVFYQDLGNVAYPTYYFNTKENNNDFNASTELSVQIGLLAGKGDAPLWSFWNSLLIDGNSDFAKTRSVIEQFSREALNPLFIIKPPSFYLDCQDNTELSRPLTYLNFKSLQGIMYLYYYGIPLFYCESSVNTWFRTSKNNKELDFYPHQEDLNYWLQEKNVSVNNDNFYFYDRSYSKQNKGIHYVNDLNFKPYDECKLNSPNKILYSVQSSELDDSDLKDNYLVNKALDYHNFSQTNGKLTGVHGIESDKVLVSFENNLQIFSSYNTLETESGTVQIGNGGMFRSKPQEFTKTDLGYLGSQHTTFLSTEFGHVIVDSKRGQVFLINSNGNGITDLTKDKMKSWFKEYLPFKLNKYYDVNIDNLNVGIQLAFDKRYNRFFLTKKDYSPKLKDIVYTNNKFYYNNIEIQLEDSRYFYNHCFTISYNFALQSWTSFHSFIPDNYLENTDYFVTIKDKKGWIHNSTNQSYQVYYGKLFPFEIEITDKYELNKSLENVSYSLDSFEYFNNYPLSVVIGFNKAIIYNNNQSTGLLELNTVDNLNLFNNKNYPIFTNKTDVKQVYKEGVFSFNQFKNRKLNNIPSFVYNRNGVDMYVNPFSVNDNTLNFDPIRSNINYIRFINDKESKYKMIFKLIDFNNKNSIR